DTLFAFAMIDTKANEDAPYFTNCRRDSFWSVTNGLPQLHINLTGPLALPSLGE
ncbi:MAG: hypothetical protein QOI88_4145, partial [Gammaproteobacteria bacterium]|nr:hypothetical protein [Gammaproteobacteria bacterium]